MEKGHIQHEHEAVEFLGKEIAILRRLRHNHIIRLHEVYESSDFIYLVLEHLKGGELYFMLKNGGLFPEAETAFSIAGVLEALVYLHERRIIHRDLKLENLLVSYLPL